MVYYHNEALNLTFGGIADPTRRAFVDPPANTRELPSRRARYLSWFRCPPSASIAMPTRQAGRAAPTFLA